METKKTNWFMFVILFCCLFVVNIAKSEGGLILPNNEGGKCFDEGTKLINIGLGLGKVYVPLGSLNSPSFSLSYEQPWPQRIGPGFLGVGAYLGYQFSHNKTNSNGFYYEHNYKYMMVTGRAAYHWDVLNSEKAEVYAGSLIGIRVQAYRYETNNVGPTANDYKYSNRGGVYPVFSMFAGARWYFARNIALYAEAGSGISYLTGGITFKF